MLFCESAEIQNTKVKVPEQKGSSYGVRGLPDPANSDC
jgi:hypothetical protein